MKPGPSIRFGFLLLAGALTAAAFFAVPPMKGPAAVTLGIASAVAGVLFGTLVAAYLKRIDPAPRKLQQRRSIAMLAAGVLIATSGVFLINAAWLTDTGTGVELPILAVKDGKVTTLDPDMATNLPITVTPKAGPPVGIGGCIWLAEKRGLFGAGAFEVAEPMACSAVRGHHDPARPAAIAVPASGHKTDWRWSS